MPPDHRSCKPGAVTDDADLGGESACLAHRRSDVSHGAVTIVELDAIEASGDGVMWSLEHGGDLDANVVHLDPNGAIGRHVNDDVDVLIVVWMGAGRLDAGEIAVDLHPGTVVQVAHGAVRSLHAGPKGLTYLSIHRRREGLTIKRPPSR